MQRVLGRFLSQGYSAHDLSRVTVVRTRHDSLVRVIAFGRLSLFGPGATRLHDKLVSVAARWIEGKESELKPFAEEADRKAVELLEQVLTESPTLEGVSASVQAKLLSLAPECLRDALDDTSGRRPTRSPTMPSGSFSSEAPRRRRR